MARNAPPLSGKTYPLSPFTIPHHAGTGLACRALRLGTGVAPLNSVTVVPRARVVDAAREIRALLDDLDLVGFLKTTGAKGLHVVVPLRAEARSDAVRVVGAGMGRRVGPPRARSLHHLPAEGGPTRPCFHRLPEERTQSRVRWPLTHRGLDRTRRSRRRSGGASSTAKRGPRTSR